MRRGHRDDGRSNAPLAAGENPLRHTSETFSHESGLSEAESSFFPGHALCVVEAGATQFCQLVMRDEEARDGKRGWSRRRRSSIAATVTLAACDLRLLDVFREEEAAKRMRERKANEHHTHTHNSQYRLYTGLQVLGIQFKCRRCKRGARIS